LTVVLTDLMVSVLLLILLATALAVAVFFCHSYARGARAASERAEALLRRHLSPSDLAHLDRFGSLQVPSRLHEGRLYAIPTYGPVTVLQDGVVIMRLCVQPRDELPGRESVLVHKLHIEASEEEYLRRANLVWRPARATVA
jgi:hypothetical protein